MLSHERYAVLISALRPFWSPHAWHESRLHNPCGLRCEYNRWSRQDAGSGFEQRINRAPRGGHKPLGQSAKDNTTT